MSTCLAIITLSDTNIQKLLANPPLVWRVVEPDEPAPYLEAVKARQKPGFVGKILGRLGVTGATEVPTMDYIAEEGAEEDLDKSWHGIHYLMTGSVWGSDSPLDFLISGGTNVGDIDLGSGPARVMRVRSPAFRTLKPARSLTIDSLLAEPRFRAVTPP